MENVYMEHGARPTKKYTSHVTTHMERDHLTSCEYLSKTNVIGEPLFGLVCTLCDPSQHTCMN